MSAKKWSPPLNCIFLGSPTEFAAEAYRRLIKAHFHWNLTWPDANDLLPDRTVVVEIYDPTHRPDVCTLWIPETAPCAVLPVLRPDGHSNIKFVLNFGEWVAVRGPIEYLIDTLRSDGWLTFRSDDEASVSYDSGHYSMCKADRTALVEKFLELKAKGKVNSQETFARLNGISEGTLKNWLATYRKEFRPSP